MGLSRRLPEFDFFYDKEGIDYGDIIPNRLIDELEKADLVFVIIGSEWVQILQERSKKPNKDWVREEVKIALEDDTKTVIPILIKNATKPKENELPVDIASLRNRQEKCFSDNNSWEENMEAMVLLIRDWYYKRPDEFLEDSLKKWYCEDALFNEIPIPNLDIESRQKITMEKYFISPSYINLKDLEKRESLFKKEATSSASRIKRIRHQFQNFIPHDIISNKLLYSNTNALVIGNPGTGKSTFARWLCYDWTQKKEAVDVIPCYVFLRNIDFSRDDLLYHALSIPFESTSVGSLQYVFKQSKKTKLWVLDGYDELSTPHQLALYKAVQNLDDNNFYLLLTRPYGMLYDPGFTFSQRLQLDGFNRGQINAYISEYLSLFGRPSKKQILLEILNDNQVLSDYAHNPMMLSFIVGVFLMEDQPKVSLSKIDSNFKLQSKVYYWIKNRELKKASTQKLPNHLQLTIDHQKLAYDMEMSLEFIKYGYSFDDWYSTAVSFNNMGLARMTDVKNDEIVFSFNSITFQEFLSALYLSSDVNMDALGYLGKFPIFWNLLKMIVGKQSKDNRQHFIEGILHKMLSQFKEFSDLKYLYLLFMFLAECPKSTVNSFCEIGLLSKFYDFFKANGVSSDKWRVLLLEAIQKVYYKLDIPKQRAFLQMLILDITPGLKPPPEEKQNEAYTMPEGTKVLVLQMSLFNDYYFMKSLFEKVYEWVALVEAEGIYAYEVVIFVLEEMAIKSDPEMLRKHKILLTDLFDKLPSIYKSSTVRLLKIMDVGDDKYYKVDDDLTMLLVKANKKSLSEEEVLDLSAEFIRRATAFYLFGFGSNDEKGVDKSKILSFFSAVSSFMDRNEVEDYNSEDIFQLCTEAVQEVNDFDVYASVFQLAISVDVSYSGVVFTDTQKLFDWFSCRLNQAVEEVIIEDLLLITYALLLCDSIQVRFHRVRNKYISLCGMYIEEHRSFFASFEGKHSDIYFQYTKEANDYYKPFDKLIYFGREDNLWGEADKRALMDLALDTSICTLAYFRDKFIPGILGSDFNLYLDSHWTIVHDYVKSEHMDALFAILRNKQLYGFESNLKNLHKIALFIQERLTHSHFEERSYLIIEFCSRVLALIYRVNNSSEYDHAPMIATLESLLLHRPVLDDFQSAEVLSSIEGVDCLGYIIAYILTQKERLNCIEDYAKIFEGYNYEQAGFLNGILEVFSDIHGVELEVVESLYPVLGNVFADHLMFLIRNAGYREQFEREVFEGMVNNV